MNLDKLWSGCLAELKRAVREESFKTWLEPTRLVSFTDNEVILHTRKGDIHAHFIEDKYREKIISVIKKVTGKDVKVIIESPHLIENKLSFPQIWNKTFNKDYSFENFIVGQSNEFAHSAAVAVSESPGITRFNPLFIYGKSGLGKTHLLQAIGNFIIGLFPEKKIVYINAVQFMEQYIKYIEMKDTDGFNKIYKTSDVLLIDDIQFLSGKQATQEVFFHIFNELFHNNKLIVITSDKYPRELDGLEERLISRFQSGLTVDIQPPNLETKIAILHKKAKRNNLNLPDTVVEYIAKNTSTNIREMEGNLIKLLAYSSMYNVDIDYTKAVEILELKNEGEQKKVYIEEILERVSVYYKISKEKIIKGSREKELIIPRQVTMYLSRKLTNSSLKNIGKILLKDHSTIIHGYNNIEKQIQNDSGLKSDVYQITKSILET